MPEESAQESMVAETVSADLIAAVYAAAERFPEHPAITAPGRARRIQGRNGTPSVKPGKTITYRELVEGIEATALSLQEDGFGAGERMLFSVRPSPAAFILALGAVRAGGSVVFIDPGIGPSLFRDRAGLAAPRWAASESLLYALSTKSPLRPLARRRGLLLPDYGAMDVRHYYSGPWLPGVPSGATPVRALAAKATPATAAIAANTAATHAGAEVNASSQEAVIIFTSGTTGAPKGVVHTRGSLAAGFEQLSTRCTFREGDRVHSEQLMMGLPALIAGAHWTMPAYGFSSHIDPLRLAGELGPVAGKRTAYDGATHLFLVPSQLAPILDSIDDGTVTLPSSLRTVMLGAAPILAPFLKRAMRLLPGIDFKLIYGMTEALPIAVADGLEKLAFASGAEAEVTTLDGSGEGDFLGEPLPAVGIRVAADHELFVRGPNVCHGYLGEDPMVEHATGDLVRLDNGGGGAPRLVMIGRKKDMIIRGKTNIYPALYEPVIAGITGVQHAVMVGVPDDIGDEAVWLAVVPMAGEPVATVKSRLDRELPRLIDESALPDHIEFLAAIPLSGRHRKPNRDVLRQEFASRTGTGAAQ
ncbi:acyl-CoA synthetase (AMP-forming)/AMP-acid ligase II [Paenarthrobacter nitroguajacolicus]|uniref:class I adenylate-forming enzyme family protein n=1 Tax=Paenarthrobacter nitroguajacolicus TaxID=211146 RepID=UPI002861A04D|nr:class I adenylate-forming enzyme family protein [Paenarthrobacter nitroguajacolicus]MDR6987726.1 acyl-CoA synthetase (AMP-forming)/AMP-acid ligase II [Paenarthrobacter nitroguajacolicus]